eukprot:30815-Pelagococcus_subviridis.AAC.5
MSDSVFPSGDSSKFPGCGSEWNVPISKICTPKVSTSFVSTLDASTAAPDGEVFIAAAAASLCPARVLSPFAFSAR